MSGASEKSWSHGNQLRLAAAHCSAEVSERVGDRRARAANPGRRCCTRRRRSGTDRPSGRSRRRSARSGAGTDRCRGSRVADSPKTSTETRTPSGLSRELAYLSEHRDRPAHRLRVHARVADLREVAVAREAHIVELDLVEAELRRLRRRCRRCTSRPACRRGSSSRARRCSASASRPRGGSPAAGAPAERTGSSKVTTRPIR